MYYECEQIYALITYNTLSKLRFYYLCRLLKRKYNLNMRIALIGYGRMGQEIEKIAIGRGHQVVLKIDVDNANDLNVNNLRNVDVVIEFTVPDTAVENYKKCFDAGVPVVSGTTGWLNRWNEVVDYCNKKNTAFFYASNFSLGVNLFFELNRRLAKMMSPFNDYHVEMTEVHHTRKLDAPSGTAISLAEQIIEENSRFSGWINNKSDSETELGILSVREGDVPGIHTIKYESEVDFIEITHSSKSRKGLAFGAVLAAEFTVGKTGILSMKEILNIEA